MNQLTTLTKVYSQAGIGTKRQRKGTEEKGRSSIEVCKMIITK